MTFRKRRNPDHAQGTRKEPAQGTRWRKRRRYCNRQTAGPKARPSLCEVAPIRRNGPVEGIDPRYSTAEETGKAQSPAYRVNCPGLGASEGPDEVTPIQRNGSICVLLSKERSEQDSTTLRARPSGCLFALVAETGFEPATYGI